MKKRKRLQIGKPIETRSINGIPDGVEALSKIAAQPPLNVNYTGSGVLISKIETQPPFWGKITSGTNPYAWEEAVYKAGAWESLTGGRSGTTSTRPAFDANGVSTHAAGRIAEMFPVAGDGVVFQSRKYGTSGGGGIPMTGCGCTTVPAVITMTSNNETCNYQMFRSCTIAYQTVPAALAALGLGSSAFLSNESFTSPVLGDTFRYLLTCLNSELSISRVYETSIFGSPFREGRLYFWLVGNSGNTCSPFSMTNGSAFLGSDLSCDVDLSA